MKPLFNKLIISIVEQFFHQEDGLNFDSPQ
jgi:hypothetical protein